MGSLVEQKNKPHVVCVPYPAQGHVSPMLKLAKILHRRGFHITLVYTEYMYNCLLRSRGVDSMKGLPSFRFEMIPDGSNPKDPIRGSNIFPTDTLCLAPFKGLLVKLNDTVSSNVPPVSCIVSDAVMSFTVDAAQELGIPDFLLWVFSATATLACTQHLALVQMGYLPLKDESYMTNGYLDTVIEHIPSINGKLMRLRDVPRSTIVNTEPKEAVLEFAIPQTDRIQRASGFLVNTFEDLELDAINALRSIQPSTYAIGPLHLVDELQAQYYNDEDVIKELGSNMWSAEDTCLEWLNSKDPNSVIFVNFGTTAKILPNQLTEFAWGLANSNQAFLFIIRADVVVGGRGNEVILPPEFLASTKERGMVSSWCPQEKVLAHRSIAGFLTHSGWNSVLESMCYGVPMICWPSFSDQFTNCWSCCAHWGIGMEMKDVKRDAVESLVRELAIGDKGKEMKKRAVEWKMSAHHSAKNSSLESLEKIISY